MYKLLLMNAAVPATFRRNVSLSNGLFHSSHHDCSLSLLNTLVYEYISALLDFRSTIAIRIMSIREALNKRGGLTLSQLASYDDLITDALVDHVRIAVVKANVQRRLHLSDNND